MAKRDSITPELIRELLDYDPETGVFTHKPRRAEHIPDEWALRRWNERYAGTVAGGRDKDGYTLIAIFKIKYRAHRLAWAIMTGEMLPRRTKIDHENGICDDNRWANLRIATSSQNGANMKLTKRSTTGYKGVVFWKKSGRWMAQIVINRKPKYLGLHDTPEQAHAAYCAAAEKHFGEFARFE